jgi:hypothetical protein
VAPSKEFSPQSHGDTEKNEDLPKIQDLKSKSSAQRDDRGEPRATLDYNELGFLSVTLWWVLIFAAHAIL